jgi:glycosyltransferase involved in cell wall biosynthesis
VPLPPGRRMKVLHVLHQFPEPAAGGTERSVAALAREQLARGHDVLVVSGSLESGASHDLVEDHRHGVRVLEIRRDDLYFEEWWKVWHPGVTQRFARLLEEERPDLVHVHHWLRLTSDLVRTSRAVGVPTVVSVHDHFSALGRPARAVGEAVAVRREPRFAFLGEREANEAFAFLRADLADELRAADLRVAPSRAHARSLVELAPEGVDLGDFEIVPPPLFERPARVEEPFDLTGRRLLAWGTWYPEKGLETVIEALRLAAGSGATWRLDVLGEASDARYGERLARLAAGLPVTFHGGRFDGARLARAAAGGAHAVLPTLAHESYGMTLDEARLLGLPGFVSDVPALRERGGTEQACFAWFRPGDAAALARSLVEVGSGRLSLQRPGTPDALLDAAAIAARMEIAYETARRRPRTLSGQPLVSPAARAERLWRAAERRFWSALQAGDDLPPPPEPFLGEGA